MSKKTLKSKIESTSQSHANLLEDLLGRKPVQINPEIISPLIEKQVVLITGAAGSIGSELCREVLKLRPSCLIALDINENGIFFLERELRKSEFRSCRLRFVVGDAGDETLLRHIFDSDRPHFIVHSAAYKHVPVMESNPCAAVKNNVLATARLAKMAELYACEYFILVSTDKAILPNSVMGATKRVAEQIIELRAHSPRTRFIAVRFGNVLGSSGSVVHIFQSQIESGGPLTLTHAKAQRYFMTVKEAADLVLQSAAIGKGGEIFVLDMGAPVQIIDLARKMILKAGLDPDRDIPIKITGLRPGEKVFENILTGTEIETSIDGKKYYIVRTQRPDAADFARNVMELETAALNMDEKKVRSKLKAMVSDETAPILTAG